MTGLFKRVGLVCLAAVVISGNAYAKIDAVQSGDTTVNISGNTEIEKKEKDVIINILSPDKDYDDLLSADSEDYGNILVYHNQGKTTQKGEFEFDIDMSGRESGLYSVYVTDSGEKANLIYTDIEKNGEAIAWLSGLTQKPAEDEFVAKQADLGFYNDLYDTADKGELLSLLFDAAENDKFNYSDSASALAKRNVAIDTFNKITAISALNSSEIKDIFDYADYIGFDDSELAEFMDLSFVDKTNFISEYTSRMSNRNFASEDDFDKVLIEEFILSAVRYPDGYNNLTAMLNYFAEDIGIKEKVTATISSNISGGNYSTTDALANDINEIIDDDSKPSRGSGSSSGRGSSSGGGVVSNKAPELQIDTNMVEDAEKGEYHVDIFTDLENVEWARESIVYLAELGIVHGDGKFKFNPENNVTREEFTKMVVQAFAPEAEEAEISFTDVSDSDWYAPYIKKAKGLGIINGQSETIFGAGQNITRQDMAVIAYNAAKMYGIGFNEENKTLFEDDETIEEYAKNAVYALRAGGIINGKENNAFCPVDNATRAEAAKIIYGLLEM